MSDSLLTAYWIKTLDSHGPLGFGVTAFSLADALQIIQAMGYRLPDDLDALEIKENVRFEDIDYRHVREHMGPMVVRGIWYPFTRLGIINS